MMPWIRLDDQFPDHPKILAAGPLAAWLYVCGIGYCNRLLTDGFIPAGQVRKLADLDNATALAARLVDVGLWEIVDTGYRVHDFLEYQPSAESIKAERAENAKRQQEWRDRRKEARNAVSNAVTDGVSNAVSNGLVTGAPYPPRTHPVPTPNLLGEVGGNTHTGDAPPTAARVRPAPKPSTLTPDERAAFDAWYRDYPNKQHRPEAERAWKRLTPDAALQAVLCQDVQDRRAGRKWQEGFIEHPATYLHNRVWEDDIEPPRLAPARASPNGKVNPVDAMAALARQFREEEARESRDVPGALDATFTVSAPPR